MQANKIELGKDYATSSFDFRATALVTVKTSDKSVNFVRGIKLRPLAEGEVNVWIETEVKNVIDTVEERDRLARERQAAEAKRKADDEARHAKRCKAAKLLADAIGATFEEKHNHHNRGPKVTLGFGDIEVSEAALDSLIAFLESNINMVKENHNG